MLKFDNGLVISMIGMYIENIFVDNKYSILRVSIINFYIVIILQLPSIKKPSLSVET